jgi:hypothetical protein
MCRNSLLLILRIVSFFYHSIFSITNVRTFLFVRSNNRDASGGKVIHHER